MKKSDPYFNIVIIGGILGGYAIAGFQGMFASAQTTNLIAIIELLLGKNVMEAMCRVGALMVFVSGIVISEYIKLKKSWNVKRIAVVVDMLAAVWLAFGVLSDNTILALYPCWFATAFQWNIFEGAQGYTSSCIFSTNNLKQFTLATTRYLCKKDLVEKNKAKYFGKVLLCFHLGVLVACAFYPMFGQKTVLLALIPGLVAFQLEK